MLLMANASSCTKELLLDTFEPAKQGGVSLSVCGTFNSDLLVVWYRPMKVVKITPLKHLQSNQ